MHTYRVQYHMHFTVCIISTYIHKLYWVLCACVCTYIAMYIIMTNLLNFIISPLSFFCSSYVADCLWICVYVYTIWCKTLMKENWTSLNNRSKVVDYYKAYLCMYIITCITYVYRKYFTLQCQVTHVVKVQKLISVNCWPTLTAS